MKKTILLLAFLVSAVTFTSCSKDDEVETPKDPIIGKWKITQDLTDGVEQDLGCDGNAIYEYKEDGTMTYEEYSRNDEDVCVLVETTNGTWKSLGNNKYEFTDDVDEWTETIEFSGNTHILTEVFNGKTHKTTLTKQ